MNRLTYFWLNLLVAGIALAIPLSLQAQVMRTDSVKVSLTEGTNFSAALSPDGQSIVMDLQGTLWLLPAAGGVAKPLTDAMGDCRVPVWSPDGKSIAFHSYRDGTYHLWLVEKTGKGLKQITFGVYDDREPFWSPDGKFLVFSSDRSRNYDIWKLEIATNKLTQLTNDKSNDYFPSYSPDGTKIAYVSERESGPGIYLLDQAGSEQLFVKAQGKLNAPVWSSDGTQIIFNSFFLGKSTLDKAGKGEWNVLSAEKEDVFPFRISWSSATSFIYTSDGQIKRKVLGTNQTTSIPFQVNINLGRHTYKRKVHNFSSTLPKPVKGIRVPVVSPDGKSVVFTALGDLWLLKKGNISPTKLTDNAYIDSDPCWSANGTLLAYSSDKGGNMDLWVRNMASGKDSLLLDLPEDAVTPSWSPDGKKVAFFNAFPNKGRGFSLKILDLETGAVSAIDQFLMDVSFPSWSPDGRFIAVSAINAYSTRYREGISEFLIIPVDKSPSRFVTPHPDYTLNTLVKNGPLWSPDGNSMAYLLDGMLWYVNVDKEGSIIGQPKRLTNELAESLSWTADSQSIVFLAVDVLKQVFLSDGRTELIPMELTWKNHIPTDDYVIHAGKVFNGKSDTYQLNADIVVKGNRIQEIVPHKAGRKGKVIDASRYVVMPGLFEMHTHPKAITGEKLGRLWLSYGITSTWEPGTNPYDAVERKESWASGRRLGPRTFITGGLLDGGRAFPWMGVANPTIAKLDMELLRAQKLEFDFLKTYVRMSDSHQQRMTAFAHQLGIPISSHEIYPAVLYGVDGIEHIGATSRRGYSPKLTNLKKSYQDVVELVVKSGINLDPTASLHGGYYKLADVDPTFFDHKQFKTFYPPSLKDDVKSQGALRNKVEDPDYAQFKNIQQTLKSIIDKGGRIIPGTDSPLIAHGLSYHAELQTWVDGGISPFQTLRAATLWSAEAVGVGNELGTIEAGKLADMVIVDGDPLKNIKDVLNVKTVIKNGSIHPLEEILSRPK